MVVDILSKVNALIVADNLFVTSTQIYKFK
jgi:hypothetical protein